MSFDVTSLTSKNTPMRWRAAAKYLIDNHPDRLANLNEGYKELLQYVHDKNFKAGQEPAAVVAYATFVSKTANGVTFDVSPFGKNVSWDADYALRYMTELHPPRQQLLPR